MADRILVSTSEMNATVSRYQQAQETMLDAQNSMSSALRNLDGCWKGPAWAAMLAKWTEIEGNITKSQLVINRSIVGLQNAIMNYEETEEANKGTGSALSEGTASTIYVEG
jgi:WXG100 family type VII secretion target